MTDDRLRMTPGPTEVPEEVRSRMAEPTANPDVEPEFFEWYRGLLDKLEAIFRADPSASAPVEDGDESNVDMVVLGGEGILGLEAAVASLVDDGDRVLCLSNGLYGDGFADFVESYGERPSRAAFQIGDARCRRRRRSDRRRTGRRRRLRGRDDGPLRDADRDVERPRADPRRPRRTRDPLGRRRRLARWNAGSDRPDRRLHRRQSEVFQLAARTHYLFGK